MGGLHKLNENLCCMLDFQVLIDSEGKEPHVSKVIELNAFYSLYCIVLKK